MAESSNSSDNSNSDHNSDHNRNPSDSTDADGTRRDGLFHRAGQRLRHPLRSRRRDTGQTQDVLARPRHFTHAIRHAPVQTASATADAVRRVTDTLSRGLHIRTSPDRQDAVAGGAGQGAATGGDVAGGAGQPEDGATDHITDEERDQSPPPSSGHTTDEERDDGHPPPQREGDGNRGESSSQTRTRGTPTDATD